MITEKQKWFIDKLIKETRISTEDLMKISFYADAEFDSYKVSSKEASHDIENLLKFKSGKSIAEIIAEEIF